MEFHFRRPPQETTVTKKEIVKTISESCGLTQLQTKEIVQKTFEAIIDTLVEDPRHRIELRNFGVFEVKKRAARKARNPRTGDKVDVPSKWVVTFKPGKEMEEKVLKLDEADRQASAAASTGSPATSLTISPSPGSAPLGHAPQGSAQDQTDA
jgi:nucleoid DNA-binding protein